MQTYSFRTTKSGKYQIVDPQGRDADWPEIATAQEACDEVQEFNKEIRQLASDEASERNTVGKIGGEME